MPQIDTHLLRCLIHKAEVFLLSLGTVGRLRALQYERHKLIPAPYLAQQFESRLGVFLHLLGRITYSLPVVGHHTVDGESRVAYHSERVLVVFLKYGYRLVITSCQHHLWSSSLALSCGMGIERLLREVLALLQYIII